MINSKGSKKDQELLTLPEHLSSHPVYSGVRVARSLVFCVVFCGTLFVLFLWSLYFLFFSDLRLLITPLLWYVQTFLTMSVYVCY